MSSSVDLTRRILLLVILLALAAYLTWSHVQYWHAQEVFLKDFIDVPWLASVPLFRPLSAVLVAAAWIAALFVPVDGLRTVVVKAAVAVVVVTADGATVVAGTSASAAQQYLGKRAADYSRDAAQSAEQASTYAQEAAREAADAARSAEECRP